jgi:hypothetical protein
MSMDTPTGELKKLPVMVIPKEIRTVLGPPPVIKGENAELFWHILGIFAAEFQPRRRRVR